LLDVNVDEINLQEANNVIETRKEEESIEEAIQENTNDDQNK
jgi:hypothetical protein